MKKFLLPRDVVGTALWAVPCVVSGFLFGWVGVLITIGSLLIGTYTAVYAIIQKGQLRVQS